MRFSSHIIILIQPARSGTSIPANFSTEVGDLVEKGRQIVHPRYVRGPLLVHQLFARFFHAGVQVADHRLGAQYLLASNFDHDSQHPVSGRVRGPEVEDHGFVVGSFVVDVVGIERHTLRQAQDATELGPQFP
jgi:hypothetical protein